MKQAWPVHAIGDVASVFDGPHATPKTVESGPIFLGISALQDGCINLAETRHVTDEDFAHWTRRVRPQAGDVVFSYETRLGQVAVIPHGLECCLGRRMGLIRFNPDKVLSKWFIYQYMSPDYQAFIDAKTIRGATVDRISIKEFPAFPVAIPDLNEQRRIVALLDEAFEAIATAKTNAEKNLQKVSELFEHAMLVMVEQPGASLTRLTMADVCQIRSKLVDPREEPYLDQLHVGAANIVSKTGELVDVLTARQEQLISGKFEFDDSMVLYSKIRPYLMKVVRPEFSGLCSADIYPLMPKPGVISRDFLYYTLLSSAFTDYAIKGSARAGMPKVNRDHLFAYQLSLPSVEAQGEITHKLDALADNVKNMQGIYARKLAALDELKKSLLHQAFSGQL